MPKQRANDAEFLSKRGWNLIRSQRIWIFLLVSLVWGCGTPKRSLETSGRPQTSLPAASVSPQSFMEKVEDSFFPYRDGLPQLSQIAPGTAITQENWHLAEGLLPQPLLDAVHNGEFTILVQPTSDLPVSPEYIAATRKFAPTVELDEVGDIRHYRAGLPFPILEVTDPQAGFKAAWNARYADSGDVVQRLESLEVRDFAGKYQYGFSFSYARAYGMHRAKPERNIAEWESQDILYKELMQVLHPVPALTIHPQLGLLHLRYWYDREVRPISHWYITGFLAINKLRTLVYDPTASAWRFPLLFEDLFGTFVRSYRWRLLDTRLALVPGFVQGEHALFGGQRAGYPLDPWELRQVHIVEAVPQRNRHPYGRKVFYFDQQTFAPLYVLMFDQQGQPWRSGFFLYANPHAYPKASTVRVPILIGRSWIDFVQERVTLAHVSDATYDQPLPPEYFTPANLIKKGK